MKSMMFGRHGRPFNSIEYCSRVAQGYRRHRMTHACQRRLERERYLTFQANAIDRLT
jgi:hypothetical protein